MRGLQDDNAYPQSKLHQFDWSEPLSVVAAVLLIAIIGWVGWVVYQNTPSELSEGHVRDHRFTAQYTHYHDGGSTCWSYDKNGNCTFSTQNPDIPHEHCVGGCFELLIEGCSDDRQGDEHCRSEWMFVSESTYNDCRNGQIWRRATLCRPQ